MRKGFRKRRACELALLLHLAEDWGLFELQPDIDREAQQHDRQQERNSPTPYVKCVAQREPAKQNHNKAEQQPDRCGALYPARIQAALALRGMLSNIDSGPAVLSANRKALQ